jgi:hypothetical protein
MAHISSSGEVTLTIEGSDDESIVEFNPTSSEFSIKDTVDRGKQIGVGQNTEFSYGNEFSISFTVEGRSDRESPKKRYETKHANWTKNVFPVEDIDSETLHCSKCSREFDKDTWIPHDGFSSPASPKWSYECPNDACKTLFIFDRNK